MAHKIIFDQPLEIEFTFIEGNSDGSTKDEIEIENLEDIECAIVSYLHKIRGKINKYKEED